MSPEDLYDPPCQPQDLGKPIPDSPHALSVCLPLWEHNVGYEEGDQAVIGKMQAGYPRFFINPIVQKLHDGIAAGLGGAGACYVFPSKAAALRCRKYAQSKGQTNLLVDSINEQCWAVIGPATANDALKQFWQHGGEILSSRAAEITLKGETPAISNCDSKQTIRKRFAGIHDCDPNDVFLFPSGMAAIYCAWRICCRLRPNLRSVQFGFPYVDTLKLQERFVSEGVHFLPNGDDSEIAELENLLSSESIQAVFCEAPTNPLLITPNLNRLRELAKQHEFPIVVDDTIGSLINTTAIQKSDLMTTSLTKFFSGAGDVLCGALTINSQSSFASQFRELINEEYDDLFFDCDADVLAGNSADAVERVTRINHTAEQVVDYLKQQPAIGEVYYPKYTSRETFESIRKPNGGFGGLFSITMKQPEKAPEFYDRLQIAKGPNLGTSFSLCCPYTILAHYDELEFVERCGVSRNLIRISVGLEDPDWLIGRFESALASIS